MGPQQCKAPSPYVQNNSHTRIHMVGVEEEVTMVRWEAAMTKQQEAPMVLQQTTNTQQQQAPMAQQQPAGGLSALAPCR